MIRKFVGREKEIKALERYYSTRGFEFVVLYGRRRIGKTALIKEFIKNKPHLYFLCDKKGSEDNIRRLKKMFFEMYGVPVLESNDLEEVLRHAFDTMNVKEKFVLVFDEFPYLVEKEHSMVSIFQRAVDSLLSEKNIMLILAGSSMSMMEEHVLSYTSPLYGRKTYALKLLPLKFRDYFSFYPNNDVFKNVEFYAVTSGIPGYMIFLDDRKTLKENILKEIASPYGRLFYEPDFLLRTEFREPETYKKILEAIAQGRRKVVEIANHVGIMPNVLSNYLRNLLSLGIIYRESLSLKRKPTSKKVAYMMADKFLEFYLLFVEPYKSYLEIEDKRMFIQNLDKNLNKYVGDKFEELVRRELLPALTKPYDIFVKYVVKTPAKEVIDVDIIAVNNESKELLAVEVKWQDLKLRDVKSIIDELHEKVQYVEWFNDKRSEVLGIFGKRVDKKAREWLLLQGYKVWDLGDVGKVI